MKKIKNKINLQENNHFEKGDRLFRCRPLSEKLKKDVKVIFGKKYNHFRAQSYKIPFEIHCTDVCFTLRNY
jgi:hypothetical protein